MLTPAYGTVQFEGSLLIYRLTWRFFELIWASNVLG